MKSTAHAVGHLLWAAWPPLLTVLVICVIWGLCHYVFEIPAYLVPTPLAVGQTAWESREPLALGGLRTALTALAGFGVAAIGGVILGALMGTSRMLTRGLYPITTLLQTVPLVAIAPLLVVWFGYGPPSAIAAAAIAAIFPVIANTVDGLRSVDPGLSELFSQLRAKPGQRWRLLALPSSLPGIITGLRIAAGLAVIGTLIGEFVGGYSGDNASLGMIILSAMRQSRTDLVFAAVGFAAVVGFALFGVVNAAGWLLLHTWHPSAQGGGSLAAWK